MNVIIGVALFIACVFIGIKSSEKFVQKRKFYEQFLSFNYKLKNEVSFGRKSLLNILDSELEKGDFYKHVDDFLSKNESEIKEKYLLDEDKEFFREYLDSIGVHDKFTQIDYLSAKSKDISDRLNCAKENEKKYRILYIKLGVLVGAIALIVML